MTSAPGPYPPAPTPVVGSSPSLRRETVIVAVGVALLFTAVTISTFYSRQDGDLDWSNYGVGLAATIGLIGVAAAAFVLVAEPAAKANLMAWPAAFGALSAGSMVAIAMDDSDATPWVAGAVIAGLAGVAYVAARRAAPFLSVVVGLAILYAKLFDTIFDTGGDNGVITAGAAVLVFTLAITAVAWLLPDRAVIAVTVGAAAVIGFVGILAFFSIFGAVASAFTLDGSGDQRDPFAEFHNDVYALLAYSLVLIAVWAVGSYLTDHVGFRVLIVALTVTIVPLAMLVLTIEHPSYWSLGLGLVGGLALVAVGLRSMRGRTPSDPVGYPPTPPAGYPPPPPPAPFAPPTNPPASGPPSAPPTR